MNTASVQVRNGDVGGARELTLDTDCGLQRVGSVELRRNAASNRICDGSPERLIKLRRIDKITERRQGVCKQVLLRDGAIQALGLKNEVLSKAVIKNAVTGAQNGFRRCVFSFTNTPGDTQ